MPAIGQGNKPVKVKAHTRSAPAPKPVPAIVPTPDQADRATPAPRQAHRARVVATVVKEGAREQARQQANARIATPDQADRQRPAAQQLHDQAVVAQNVKTARRAVVTQQHAGSLGRVIHNLGQGKYQSHYKGPGDEELASINPGQYVSEKITRFARNAALDAGELAVTTPSSVAHLVSTAATHPKKVPGMLAAPYVQLAEHPAKQAFEHPVTTGLMLDPLVKVPGRAVGRVLRATGKQTLERPAATLPGTALKETRTGSRDAVVRAHQARADAKNPAPTMTDKQVQRRVDEFRDVAQQHRNRVTNAAAKQIKERGLTGDDAELHMSGALGGAAEHADRKFAEEFGSTWQVGPGGTILKPKGATKGVVHDTEAKANKIAAVLNKKGGARFAVHEVGDGAGFGVVPDVAKTRLYKHQTVGSSKATGAKVLKTSRGAFTQAVLPLSPKWLAGQVAESGVRAAVAHAGPFDFLRVNKVVKKLNAQTPGAGDELLARISGGHFGLTGPAREFATGKSLADEFSDTGLAKPARAATAVGNTAPLRLIRAGWGKYTRAMLDGINGVIENTSRKAMAGQAIRNMGLMDQRVVGLSDKAITDAAHGLKGTENQVALARAVDRMYGQYQKFSPEMRTTLLHWTPFLPWYLNSVKFLTRVLPVDHPVIASLLAAANATSEDWRKQHDLSLLQPNHVPDFLLGSYPKGAGYLRVAHYTPFGIGSDPTGAAGSLLVPQLVGALLNAYGDDYKGDELKYPGYDGRQFNTGEKAVRALVTAAESQIPGVSQVGQISGITPRYVDHKTAVPSVVTALKKQLPWTPTSGGTASGDSLGTAAVAVKPVSVKAVKVKPLKVKAVKVR